MAVYSPRWLVRLLQWRRRLTMRREAQICGWRAGWDK